VYAGLIPPKHTQPSWPKEKLLCGGEECVVLTSTGTQYRYQYLTLFRTFANSGEHKFKVFKMKMKQFSLEAKIGKNNFSLYTEMSDIALEVQKVKDFGTSFKVSGIDANDMLMDRLCELARLFGADVMGLIISRASDYIECVHNFYCYDDYDQGDELEFRLDVAKNVAISFEAKEIELQDERPELSGMARMIAEGIVE
jgi:hypothetical protein